jgi:small subunit ribosomal protein S1
MQKSNVKLKLIMDEALKNGFSKMPKANDVVEGVVIGKEGSNLYVDLGVFGTGLVYGREFYEAQDMIKPMNSGDPVSGKVVELDNEEGYVELSLKEAGYDLAWEDLFEKKKSGEVVEAKIEEANKGGLVAKVNSVPAFLPVSQLLANHYPRVEGGDKAKIYQELSKFIGDKFKVRIIDLDKRENKLIISEKEAQNDDMKKILEHVKVGDIVLGEISGVVNFGVFVKFTPEIDGVDIEEVEGLVHISELDWQLIDNPADIVTVGDKVKAKIISIEGDKISLSIKALKKDPWLQIEEKYKVGDHVKGTITKVNPFGAFVKLDDNIHGLCHISEFGSEANMKETLTVGKDYDFTIQSIVKEDHRMALSFGKKSKETKKETASKEDKVKVSKKSVKKEVESKEEK